MSAARAYAHLSTYLVKKQRGEKERERERERKRVY